MYPASFFGLFPPFPRDYTVFVIISFDQRFQRRWTEVIEPAIRGVSVNGMPFTPIRVDARVVGDSIMTEILAGIGKARVVFADVTAIGTLEGKAMRNGNVMYEIGLAHAVRLPEEVLLFRSDSEPLLFDTAHVRVNTYSPDQDPLGAKRLVGESIVSAIEEVDLRRHLAVQQVADSLDSPSVQILARCQVHGQVEHPPLKTMGQVLTAVSTASAIQRLLSLGLLKVRYKSVSVDQIEALNDSALGAVMPYERTPFGDAVFLEVGSRLVRTEPHGQNHTSPDASAA